MIKKTNLTPTFQVRRAIDLLTQPEEINLADLELICERVVERFTENFIVLYAQWISENRLGFIGTYEATVQKWLRLIDPHFKVIGSCRRPFMFHTTIYQHRVTFKVTQDYISFQTMR